MELNPFAFASSSALDWYEGRRAQKLERERIGQQQAFNREMYEKRYQMTMADMRKAGLNPILAYKQGAGAAPTSGGGSFQPVKVNLADNIMKGAQANSAVETARTQNIQNQLSQQTLDIIKQHNKNYPNMKISLDLLKMPKTLLALQAMNKAVTLDVPDYLGTSAKEVAKEAAEKRRKRLKIIEAQRKLIGYPKYKWGEIFSTRYWRRHSSLFNYLYRMHNPDAPPVKDRRF